FAEDAGGVHFNSGIPSHAYSLLVDGGTYNGQTIQGIGLTKAANIYFRAMTVYQVPASDFADHAEALEAATADLIGVNLKDLQTGQPSGQIITATDAQQVHKATLAAELRSLPTNCGNIQFSSTTNTANEADGKAIITVTRTDNTSSKATVDYA